MVKRTFPPIKISDDQLVAALAARPALSDWDHDGIAKSPLLRYAQAYVEMANKGRYRPAAPTDGFGTITISNQELRKPERLIEEAARYALQFYAADQNDGVLYAAIGCTHFTLNRAAVYAVEAARLLNGCSPATAKRLLRMAIKEVDASGAKEIQIG